MSLYNMLFGVNPASKIFLAMIDLDMGDIPRFRNVYLNIGEDFQGGSKDFTGSEPLFIAVHTRTGGGNREFYDEHNEDNPDGPWNSTMRENEYFVYDCDDDFDCTYATFFFSVPKEYLEGLKEVLLKGEHADLTTTPGQQWETLFEKLNGPTKTA